MTHGFKWADTNSEDFALYEKTTNMSDKQLRDARLFRTLYIRQRNQIAEYAKTDPYYLQMLEKVDKGITSAKYVCRLIKNAEKHKRPPALPEGKYDIIVANIDDIEAYIQQQRLKT